MITGEEWIMIGTTATALVPMMGFLLWSDKKYRKDERKRDELFKEKVKQNKRIMNLYDEMHNYKKEDAVKISIKECQVMIRKINEEFGESDDTLDKEWITRINLKIENAVRLLERYNEFEGQKKEVVQKEIVEVFYHIQDAIKEKLNRIIEEKYEEDLIKIKEKKEKIKKI